MFDFKLMIGFIKVCFCFFCAKIGIKIKLAIDKATYFSLFFTKNAVKDLFPGWKQKRLPEKGSLYHLY